MSQVGAVLDVSILKFGFVTVDFLLMILIYQFIH